MILFDGDIMGWLQQSYKHDKHSQSGRQTGGGRAGVNLVTRGRLHDFRRSSAGIALAALMLLMPFSVSAADTATRVKASSSSSEGTKALRAMNEDDLRRVAAQGLTEDRMFRFSRYAAGGFGVEVLGDMATLLNPVASILDADITFQDAVFNPLNPTVLIDSSGSSIFRIPQTVGVINIENIRVRGSNGRSFGSVTIRDLDLRGTTIRVTARR